MPFFFSFALIDQEKLEYNLRLSNQFQRPQAELCKTAVWEHDYCASYLMTKSADSSWFQRLTMHDATNMNIANEAKKP